MLKRCRSQASGTREMPQMIERIAGFARKAVENPEG